MGVKPRLFTKKKKIACHDLNQGSRLSGDCAKAKSRVKGKWLFLMAYGHRRDIVGTFRQIFLTQRSCVDGCLNPLRYQCQLKTVRGLKRYCKMRLLYC